VKWLVLLILALTVYFGLSGVSFVVQYKWPAWHSPSVATRFFVPLEWVARRWKLFQRLYTGFHFWCYRRGVHDYSR
jgi:hypothetical protein